MLETIVGFAMIGAITYTLYSHGLLGYAMLGVGVLALIAFFRVRKMNGVASDIRSNGSADDSWLSMNSTPVISDSNHSQFLSNEEVGKAEIIRLVNRHGKTLVAKNLQLVTKDDYGNYFFEKWWEEQNYFIEKVIYREFGITPFGLSNEEVEKIVSDQVYDLMKQQDDTPVGDIDGMTPIEFERYCATALEQQGWQTRLTKASGDQGADVIAEKNGVCVAIQCKKYSSPVGNAAVQEILAGKTFYNADIAVVVTNSSYTPHARQLAKATDVHLMHHTELADFDALI